VGLVVGIVYAIISLIVAQHLRPMGDARTDFDHLWAAAGFLAHGQNPYRAIGPQPAALFRFDWPLVYPLTTVVALLPFHAVPLEALRSVFVGGSVGLFTVVLLRGGWWSAVWLVSMAVFQAAGIGQWSPLTAAAALLPRAQPLLALKPQHVVVWTIATGSGRILARTAGAAAVLFVVAWWLHPGWTSDWLTSVRMPTKSDRSLCARWLGRSRPQRSCAGVGSMRDCCSL
jgi:hypothetical protein